MNPRRYQIRVATRHDPQETVVTPSQECLREVQQIDEFSSIQLQRFYSYREGKVEDKEDRQWVETSQRPDGGGARL